MAAPPTPGPGSGGNRGALAQTAKAPAAKPAPKANPNSLDSQATAIANAQTTGPISELAAQMARQTQQGQAAQGKTFGYYMQLAQQAQDALHATQGVGNDLNNTLSGIGSQTQGALQGFGQAAAGGALGHMGSLGLDGGGLANIAAESARQQGIGALNAGVFRSSGATQGANYSSLAASNLGTNALRGQERIGDIGRAAQLANVPLNSKMAALTASKGALKANALAKLTQQDFTNKVTLAGLGLKQADFGLKTAVAKSNASLGQQRINATLTGQQQAQMRSDRTFNLDQQKFGFTKAKDNYMRTHGLGPYKLSGAAGAVKPLSAISQQHIYQQIDSVRSRITQAIAQFVNWGASPQDAAKQAYHALQTGRYYGKDSTGKWAWHTTKAVGDVSLLNAAYNTRQGGVGLTPGDIKYLQKRGLTNISNRLSVVQNQPLSKSINGAAGGILNGII